MSPSDSFGDSSFGETVAHSANGDFSKEQQDIAMSALLLRTGALTERQLAQGFASWTLHGNLPLNEHLLAIGMIDDDTNKRIKNGAPRLLEEMEKGGQRNSSVECVVAQTLDAVDPAGTIARLMGIRAVAGSGAADATGVRTSEARYKLLRKLGQGGLGRVWLAYDEHLKRPVAVKEITARDQATALERFRREAEITGRLEHPGIVPIYQLGEDAATGQAFYAMRFLGKETLHDSLMEYHERVAEGDHDPMLLRRLLTDFVNVCQAIGHAHSRKVIHRDLKPENVAIDSFGQVIVIDWGIAKVIDELQSLDHLAGSHSAAGSGHSTMEGQILGTPLYMAPEQAAGRVDELDERTDIYGLGAILYAILTGSAPHEQTRENSKTTTGRELLSAIAGRPSPSVLEANPHADPALAAICAKAMARRQYARYQSATELAEDVERWMAGEHVSAYRERPLQKLARWIQNHRIWSQAIGLLVVTGIVGLTVMIVASHQAARANRQVRFDEMRGYSRELEVQLRSTAEQVSKDARFMSNLPPIQTLIAPPENAADGESEEVWKSRLGMIYEEFLRANPDYVAIAYMKLSEEAATDIVRVERNTSDAAYIRRVPTSRLIKFEEQNVLRQTMQLDRGDVQLVLRDANDDPTDTVTDGVRLFAATPVYDAVKGDLFGVVVVQVNLLNRLSKFLARVDQGTAIIDVTDGEGNVWISDKPGVGVVASNKVTPISTQIPELKEFFSDPDQTKKIDAAAGVIASKLTLDRLDDKTTVGVVLKLTE
ncbi:serine/threonine protein kinase [Blastopirellula sp. JC732]|uniref:Serine/threonine protein kinase n=1 Tax=Blastopirellula sediminis TaxID=2894196 RepID=A0A9X1MTG8_9BACT|nr:serine/threonine-protein kinase [Blastopirellula sediminis]MCC9604511.1 serine/threonine protein kinase [Blastopirellula sediminis]MCC9632190.1 serine/threonine protein kinase [Blastopirellula sediminis]